MSDIPKKYFYDHVVSDTRVSDIVDRATIAMMNAGFPQTDLVDDVCWTELAAHLLWAEVHHFTYERGFDYPCEVKECRYNEDGTVSMRVGFEDEIALVLFRALVI